jgi:uncharacterized integral membrane protein
VTDAHGSAEQVRIAERRRRLVRTAVIAVILILVVAFVVENSQAVVVHLWFWRADIRLIWVILGCLVVGGVVGYFIARPPKALAKRKAAKAAARTQPGT